ncbi:C40 family peptidase [Sulfuricurvum sp.]|uniref:C40 family peptidase n=1 Tax=Sulfuricurvum sp. TaxID=2025608 RepID=UPI0025EA17D4|nr:C40 family peptidase [Sulfuricurvum sp.]
MKRTALSLILLILSAQAESQRGEPSLFLEYERELKKTNETQKVDENPFIKTTPPLVNAKPIPLSEPILKSVAHITPVLRNDKVETDSIGQDAKPFLVIPKPAPITSKEVCQEKTVQAEEPKSKTQKIVHNIRNIKDKLLARAKEFLGTPYGFGSRDGERTDCSGFTQQVYRQFGVSLPRSVAEQAQLGEEVSMDDLQIGDLLFYHTYKSDPSHVAIYAGDGQIIHASYINKKVQFDSIDKAYYKQHFMYAKRIALNDPDYDK